MRVDAQKQRSVYIFLFAVIANGLRDGQNVSFIEACLQCGAPVSRGTKSHSLRRHRPIRNFGVVGSNKLGYIRQHVCRNSFAGEVANFWSSLSRVHVASLGREGGTICKPVSERRFLLKQSLTPAAAAAGASGKINTGRPGEARSKASDEIAPPPNQTKCMHASRHARRSRSLI